MMNFEKQIITNFAVRNYRGNSADLIVLRTDARKNRQAIRIRQTLPENGDYLGRKFIL